MDPNIFSKMIINSDQKIKEVERFKHQRDLYFHILSKKRDYIVGIKGLRGIGKTTLLLQIAKSFKKPLYFSADAIYLAGYTIYDIITYAKRQGYQSFFIDEIHFKKDWTYSLKTLYDEGELNIFFTGSSAIDLFKGADLSRRAVIYELPPATFREYLLIKKGKKFPSFSLSQIINKKSELVRRYISAYNYILEYFSYGGVLYNKEEFDKKIKNSLMKLITYDLSYLREIDINTETDIIKIYQLLSTTASYEVNYSRLAAAIGVSKNTIKKLISDLEKAGGIFVCNPCKKGYALIRQEPKLLLPIPFTAYFNRELLVNLNTPRIREEFFISHVRKGCYLKTKRGAKTPDFLVDEKSFEIGGVSKTHIQNPDYIVVDSIDIIGNKIPLFLFGFLQYVQ